MAGKKAVCPNCRAIITVPEMPTAAIAEPTPNHDISTSLDIASSPEADAQAADEKAALRILRLVYVFFRDDWRRLLTCAHLGPVFFLLFFPWLNISCVGRTIATQTGLQTCTGGFTIDTRLEKAARDNNDKLMKESPSWSALSTLFIVFVFLGGVTGLACIVCVFLRMSAFARATHLFSLGLGGAAFLSLAAQMAIGFPVERQIKQQIEKGRAERDRQNPPLFQDPGEAWVDLDTRYTFWLWLSFLITFVSAPAFVLEFAILIGQATRHYSRQRDDSG